MPSKSRLKKRRERRETIPPTHPLGFLILPRLREHIDPSLTWYALWCRANHERKAEEALSKVGIASYRPLETRRVVQRSRIVEVDRAPVGRYLFAGLNEDQHFWNVRGALHLPFDRPLGTFIRTEAGPMQVPAELLQVFSDAVTRHGEPIHARSPFRAGTVARIIEGPLAGFLAAIESSSDERVRGLVRMFGRRLMVEFEPEQLEAA